MGRENAYAMVHIHHGKVHGEADFDHDLYYLLKSAPVARFMQVDRARELPRAEWPCHRVRIPPKGENPC